jgi:hypothetical protein
MVQPKAEIDLQLEATKLSTPLGYTGALALGVATFGTIALMSGFFLKSGASFDDYISNVVPLFGGFLSILGVSEVKCYGSLSFRTVKRLLGTHCPLGVLNCSLIRLLRFIPSIFWILN